MSKQLVGVPLGTRLHAVVIGDDYVDIWIALKSRGPDVSLYQGTYLRCYHNGRVTRVTRDDNYDVDDWFEVRPADPVKYKHVELGYRDGEFYVTDT